MAQAHITRRTLLCAATLALVLAGCATIPAHNPAGNQPTQQMVQVPAADGTAGALLFTPAGTGPWPSVLLFADANGLRPLIGEIGADLAKAGYVVLAPNAFYRTIALDGSTATAAPVLPTSEAFARGQQWRALATDDAVIADAAAFVRFLDGLPQVDRNARIGAVGYDVGGAHAFLAARALPARIGVVAAAHPGGIATARDNSPHLFVGQTTAAYLIELAAPDDTREPGDKDDLRAVFNAAGLRATVSVVPDGRFYALSDQPDYSPAGAARFLAGATALLDAELK